VAAAWLAGSILGYTIDLPWWMWYTVLLLGTPWWVMSIQSGRLVLFCCVLLAITLLAGGRSAAARQVLSSDHILHYLGSERAGPVELRVMIEGEFGSATLCNINSVKHLGAWIPSSGSAVLIGAPAWIEPNQTVQCLARFRVSRNENTQQQLRLFIVDPFHVLLLTPPSRIARIANTTRALAHAALVSGPNHSIESNSLVLAIVMGARQHDWDEVADPFQRTGTAHLLAVSGLHLAIVCWFVFCLARVVGMPPRAAALLSVIVILMMLLLITIRTPILRSAVMATTGAVLLGIRWRISAGTTLSIAVILVLYSNPLAILRPGFQLSFAVVAALIWLLPAWSSRSTQDGQTMSWWASSLRAATVAWSIATPISMYHFGMYSVLGIPATLLLTPVMASVLLLGYTKLMCVWLTPVSMGVDYLLDFVSWLLWTLVNVLAGIPGAGLLCGSIGWYSVLLVEAATIVFFVAKPGAVWRWSGLCVLLWWITVLLVPIH